MKRREFVGKVGAGSAALVAGGVMAGSMAGDVAAQHGGHAHENVNGPLANATVSFGAWPPGDRTAPPPPGQPPPNLHQLVPSVTTIKRGGTVNFIVAGLHQIVAYGQGKTPDDVRAAVKLGKVAEMPPAAVPLPPVIDDEDRRVFRGVFPSLFFPIVDRVEVVQFTRPGVYLVICAIVPHFINDDMYGWVRVLR
jgi:hypothetical protein